MCRFLRELVDPRMAPLRTRPKVERDLFIAASNGHVLVFDNMSSLTPWLSDSLARLSTGGGLTVRALFTDAEEAVFDVKRPIF
jgi:pyridoxine 5'-phosphate synthase PdxJ